MLHIVAKDFQRFSTRGLGPRLLVAFILGSAIHRATVSLVDDVLMAPLGLIANRRDLQQRFIDLSGHGYRTLAAARAAGVPTLNYGLFVNAAMHLLVTALVAWPVVRMMNRLSEPTAPRESAPQVAGKDDAADL